MSVAKRAQTAGEASALGERGRPARDGLEARAREELRKLNLPADLPTATLGPNRRERDAERAFSPSASGARRVLNERLSSDDAQGVKRRDLDRVADRGRQRKPRRLAAGLAKVLAPLGERFETVATAKLGDDCERVSPELAAQAHSLSRLAAICSDGTIPIADARAIRAAASELRTAWARDLVDAVLAHHVAPSFDGEPPSAAHELLAVVRRMNTQRYGVLSAIPDYIDERVIAWVCRTASAGRGGRGRFSRGELAARLCDEARLRATMPQPGVKTATRRSR